MKIQVNVKTKKKTTWENLKSSRVKYPNDRIIHIIYIHFVCHLLFQSSRPGDFLKLWSSPVQLVNQTVTISCPSATHYLEWMYDAGMDQQERTRKYIA